MAHVRTRRGRIRRPGLFFRHAAFAGFLATLAPWAAAAPELSLAPIDAPLIKDKKIIYTIRLVTPHCPKDLWWFFDSSDKQIVVETYDEFVQRGDTIKVEGSLPVKKIEVRNLSTALVPSGKKTRILLHLKEEMHCTTHCSGDTLKIILWKTLASKQVIKKKVNPLIIPLSVIVGSAALTVAVLGFYFRM